MFIRFLLIAFLGYLLYRILHPKVLSKPKKPYVRGNPAQPGESKPKAEIKNVEDADFEELD